MCNGNPTWSNVFLTALGSQETWPFSYEGETKKVIDKTGYSWRELARIEYAFECATKINNYDYRFRSKDAIIQDQYNGLMAVVEVLCEIEGISAQETKEMFSYKIEENKPVMA